jgi:hypothetical protein
MIEKCYKNLEKKGHHCFQNFLSPNEILKLKKLVLKNLKINKGNSFFMMDNNLSQTFASNNSFLKKFYDIFFSLCKKDNLKDYGEKKIFKNLRVISKSKMHSTSFDFHFDAHQYTILVPILIPNNKDKNLNGNLILFPNIRKKTNFLIINIVQKLFFQNKIMKNILKYISSKKIIKQDILTFKVGNVYIFNGYRSLHGNQAVSKDQIRATLLLHFYDVFSDSLLIKLNRKFRELIENRNIDKNKNFK